MPAALLALPTQVLDLVFDKLTSHESATCSLVCSAWRNVPYERLTQLELRPSVSRPSLLSGLLAAGLWRCRRLHTLSVSSTTDDIPILSAGQQMWPECAAALCQQQLPSLRELHIKHSRELDTTQLQQLHTILEVQGPRCVLHLAVTDKSSLEALIPLLPFRGLARLELNTSRVQEGILQLLLHAARVQGTAVLNSNSSNSNSGDTAMPAQGAVGVQQPVLQVGLWVCCWGGFQGLQLADALDLYSKMRKAPGCVVTSLETIVVTSTADLEALSQLQGLHTVGIAFPEATARSSAEGSKGSQQDPSGLAALSALSSSLKKLRISGAPPGGWTAGQLLQRTHAGQQPSAGQLLPGMSLTALTGLSHLSFHKDRSGSAHALSVVPVSALTLLRDLTLERTQLQAPDELCCLSSLTNLTALVLVVQESAHALLKRVVQGSWSLAVPHDSAQPQQQQQQREDAVVGALGVLSVQSGGHAAAASGDGAEWKACLDQCSCCCGAEQGFQPANTGNGGTAAEGQVGDGPEGLLDADRLQQQVLACPVLHNRSCPELLDWSWLMSLQQLQSAKLQVPHLNLACLPNSLVRLCMEKLSDDDIVSITCSNSHSSSGSRSSSGSAAAPCVSLPHLQSLMLSRLLPPIMSIADGISEYEAGDWNEGGDIHSDGPVSADDADEAYTDDNDADHTDDLGTATHNWEPRLHHAAVLLLALVKGCPELRELDVPYWTPPTAATLAAAQHLRLLRELSVSTAGTGEVLRQQVDAVRARAGLKPVKLCVGDEGLYCL